VNQDLFESYIDKTETCWIWTGTVQANGYGRYGLKYAHRLAYELYVGEIPEDLHIDHLCRNTLCVNPEHMEPTTRSINLKRQLPKTHCRKGHELTAENTYVNPMNGSKPGVRQCRICLRARQRKQYYERSDK